MKKCSRCGKIKELNEFGKRSQSKDGLRYSCKDCQKEYRQKNKDKIRKYKKEYYLKNKDRRKAYLKEYYLKNKEYINDRNNKYYQKNKSKTNLSHREKYLENRNKINKFHENGCAICKHKFHYSAMDFHHIDPKTKKFTIGQKVTFSKELVDEIRKTVSLCSCCHRRFHYGDLKHINLEKYNTSEWQNFISETYNSFK